MLVVRDGRTRFGVHGSVATRTRARPEPSADHVYGDPKKLKGDILPYFPELSAYEYNETLFPMRNVGWLSRGREFLQGEAPAWVIEGLVERAKHPDVVTRGSHRCDVCASADEPGSPASDRSGNGEIWLCNEEGEWFAAPTLIVHYITEHHYLPPVEFIDALRGSDPGEFAGLKRMDRLLMLWCERGDLESLLRWIEAPHQEHGWQAPSDPDVRAGLEGGEVSLRILDEDGAEEPEDPDDQATCEARTLVHYLSGYLGR